MRERSLRSGRTGGNLHASTLVAQHGGHVARLIESRRTGLSLRLQVFIPLATITLILSAIFAIVVIDRFTARASLFATRAAEDEARGLAELAARTPQESLRPVLQAFTRSAIDTDVALLDAQGRVVLEAGEANQNVARVWASLDIPVLALFGEFDIRTLAMDHEYIAAIVNASAP